MKAVLISVAMVFASVLAGLTATEIYLRSTGTPPLSQSYPAGICPTIWCGGGFREYAEETGWYTAAGVWPKESEQRPMTVLAQGRRAIEDKPARKSGAPGILILGGSISQGIGVRDSEHYGAVLQRVLPNSDVTVLATEGYGTSQVLGTLERIARKGPAIQEKVVVYGFIGHHLERNSGTYLWNKPLSDILGMIVDLPHAELDNGNLVQVPLRTNAFFSTGLMGELALSAVLKDWWMRQTMTPRADDAEEITQRLLLRLDEAARQRGSKLVVAILDDYLFDPQLGMVRTPALADRMMAYMRDNGIDYVDLRLDWRRTQLGLVLKNGGHPNEKTHLIWGHELGGALVERHLGGLPATGLTVRHANFGADCVDYTPPNDLPNLYHWGNATSYVARQCAGRSVCDLYVDIGPDALSDPVNSCAKDIQVEYFCGPVGTARRLISNGDSFRKTYQLSCPPDN